MTVHLTHWGAFEAVSDGERLTDVRPWRGDPEPMRLIDNVASAQHHPARIAQPHVRQGWLDQGPGAHVRPRDASRVMLRGGHDVDQSQRLPVPAPRTHVSQPLTNPDRLE